MRFVRALLVVAVAAVPVVAAAPQAAACIGLQCVTNCVRERVEDLREGDPRLYCPR